MRRRPCQGCPSGGEPLWVVEPQTWLLSSTQQAEWTWVGRAEGRGEHGLRPLRGAHLDAGLTHGPETTCMSQEDTGVGSLGKA